MTAIVFSTATELASAIRQKQVSAVEVLEAHLAQIAQHNSKLHAVVTLDEDGARTRAREADAALAQDEVWGPLHGVPVTLEDFKAVTGMRTTWGGQPEYADYVPKEDCTVAARLRQAGAVILGRTYVEVGENSIFNHPNNPWDLERTPGGSCGGSAAATAAGLIPLDVGSDAFGSILRPSAFCGVFGMRPTEHRVSNAGCITNGTTWMPFSVQGPFARSVDDLALALQVIAGPDSLDTLVPPVPWRNAGEVNWKDLRIAWSHTFPQMPLARDIHATVENLAADLDRLGAHIEQALPELDFVAAHSFSWEFIRYNYWDWMTSMGWIARDTPAVTIEDYLKAVSRRAEYIVSWERFFARWDAFLCPVWMHTANLQNDTVTMVDGQAYASEDVSASVVSISPLTGLPSVVIPVGLDSQGLPIGLQLIGRRWEDERLLAIAKLVSEVAGGFRRPPGY